MLTDTQVIAYPLNSRCRGGLDAKFQKVRGASLIEFVIGFPLLLILIAGAIQIGLLYMHRAMVLDALDTVATKVAQYQDVCGYLEDDKATAMFEDEPQIKVQGAIEAELAQSQANFLLPSSIFSGGTGLGVFVTVCQNKKINTSDPTVVKVDFSVKYTLPCPLCGLMTLGAKPPRIETALRRRILPEFAPFPGNSNCPDGSVEDTLDTRVICD